MPRPCKDFIKSVGCCHVTRQVLTPRPGVARQTVLPLSRPERQLPVLMSGSFCTHSECGLIALGADLGTLVLPRASHLQLFVCAAARRSLSAKPLPRVWASSWCRSKLLTYCAAPSAAAGDVHFAARRASRRICAWLRSARRFSRGPCRSLPSYRLAGHTPSTFGLEVVGCEGQVVP